MSSPGSVSGIDATVGLFAAGSYWDARLKAYYTLKGMSDLYETVRGLLSWLREAQIRVQNDIGSAQALDGPRWAPTEMENAEQKYHDAVTQMQAGNLNAAIDSMKAAGQIALRLHILQDTMDKRGARVPLAAMPAPPEDGKEVQGHPPGLQPRSVDNSLVGQRIRIADMSMSPGGLAENVPHFSAAVARFDVVAAEGLMDAGSMEKVLSGMDDGWEAAVSRTGYFGFIYNDRVQMTRTWAPTREKTSFATLPMQHNSGSRGHASP